MSAWQLVSLVVAAVLVFWVVGAYNRLVALRTAIGAAWAQVEEPVLRREEVLGALASRLRGVLTTEHGALDAVVVALAQTRAAVDAVRARPVAVQPLAAFSTQEAALGAALSRVVALVDHDAALREDAEAAASLAQLREAATRLASARQWFNDAAASYDAAIAQWPTRALLPWFGFGRAGRL